MHDLKIETIRINGGRLCLDFVNTRSYPALGGYREFLRGFGDLVLWAQREALIEAPDGQRLMANAREEADLARRALNDAVALRSALRCLFASGAATDTLRSALDDVTRTIRSAAPTLHLEARNQSVRYVAAPALDAWLLGPLAISAMELVTSPDRAHVKICPGEDCHWLFLDQSRNGTRRWCSMDSCGGKAKARTHYETHRRPNRSGAAP